MPLRSPGEKQTAERKTISEKCTNCDLCVKECGFLKTDGTPKEIADTYDPFDRKSRPPAFECSLSRLCAAVCPEKDASVTRGRTFTGPVR